MAARHGRLYNKKGNEGGADVNYEPPRSDFEVAGGRGGSNFAATGERFKVNEMAPDVDVATAGIGDSAQGRGTGAWNNNKPRFQTQQANDADYETAVSEFDKAGTKGKQWIAPSKADRDGVQLNQEQVNAPVPYDKPGAFDHIGNKPSVNANARPRFGETKPATNGEPNAPLRSDFDNAAMNSKPSANSMAGGQRFKNATPSYGDPGAGELPADRERRALEAKIARQRAQAEAEAARVAAQYE